LGKEQKPVIEWINSEEYEKDPQKLKELKKLDGVIVPGGSAREALRERSGP